MKQNIEYLESGFRFGGRSLDPQQEAREHQMPAGRNGQELTQPLNQSENCRFKYIHRVSPFFPVVKILFILTQKRTFGKLDVCERLPI